MFNNISLFLLLCVFLILFNFLNFNKNKNEHFSTLNKIKKKVLKCCSKDDCPGKPPYLNKNCLKNKEESRDYLENQYKKLYTIGEYNKVITKKKIIDNKIKVLGLDEITNKKIDNDDKNIIESYNPSNTNYFTIKNYQPK